MRVLIACEFTGTVRRAFRGRGHDAWSCDLLDAADDSPYHIKGDARDHLHRNWDLMIAHPPCTRLCNSGVRWLKVPPPGRTLDEIWWELEEGARLFGDLLNADEIPMRCVENPVMHKYAKELIDGFFPHTQSVQPWQFGHGEIKRTCFWLINLAALEPTNVVPGRWARAHRESPSADRWARRSGIVLGLADAMAAQWGGTARS